MIRQNIEPKRNRIKYATGILVVIGLGLVSRSGLQMLPKMVEDYAGDILWALVAYLAVAFFFPRLSIRKVALFAGLFSFLIEVSQLYQSDWIKTLRQLPLVGLLLGYDFAWSDLVCYFVGITIGALLEFFLAQIYLKKSI